MSQPVLERRQFAVAGNVIAVSFRDLAIREAKCLGVTGWVRNNLDTWEVEGEAQGTRDALDAFVRFLKAGRPESKVRHVRTSIILVVPSETEILPVTTIDTGT